jgi:hypothetical protein
MSSIKIDVLDIKIILKRRAKSSRMEGEIIRERGFDRDRQPAQIPVQDWTRAIGWTMSTCSMLCRSDPEVAETAVAVLALRPSSR